ncbi:MAG: cob(I)yrinic acid a,c-diamide adenosyltransferase [Anaerolineae bacterium]|nr:MAG: cob(I)yrinic acid a,c-diamide adenosyltransferase [Anaerolineae bacterium]
MSASFYTRKGDDGYTGLLGAGRVPKYHPRPAAYGAIDEATAALGVARAFAQNPETKAIIQHVQRDLYHLMAEVAATPDAAARFRVIEASHVAWLEEKTDSLSGRVPLPTEFILPGDSRAGALLDVARTTVRRAEQRVAYLLHQGEIENPALLQYLNRLSSLCFVLELLENQEAGKDTTLAREAPHDRNTD